VYLSPGTAKRLQLGKINLKIIMNPATFGLLVSTYSLKIIYSKNLFKLRKPIQKQIIMIESIFITAIVFFGVYHLIKVFTDYFLKRKIIKAGHIDKAGILDPVETTQEENRYPTLKWGLVFFMAGAGLIIIELLSWGGKFTWVKDYFSAMPIGIELVFISLGFLIYFFIVNSKKK